jgi:hypothetical protein
LPGPALFPLVPTFSADCPAFARFWFFQSSNERNLAVSRADSFSDSASLVSGTGVGIVDDRIVAVVREGIVLTSVARDEAAALVVLMIVGVLGEGVAALSKVVESDAWEAGVDAVVKCVISLVATIRRGEVCPIPRHCWGRVCVI